MSARERERGRRRPKAAPAARVRSAGGRSRWLWTALAIMALGLIAWLIVRPQLASRGAESAASGASTGPAAAMTPQAAYETGLRLAQSGHHEASLPYYRRALEGKPITAWVVHYNYGGALYNVGLEVRDRRGVAVPVTRSSIERVAMMRDALAELDIAERLTINTHDRAIVIRARGERFQIWGFPWDAFVQLRQAQWTDSLRRELGGLADAYMEVLEHPERQNRAARSAGRP